MFRYDLHVHSSEVSPCGRIPAKEMVDRYKAAGYDGFVLTDHYNRYYMDHYGLSTWEEKTAHFLSGYRMAREYGEQIGFTVLLGAELNVSGAPNEYLLYGLTEAFLEQHPALYETDLFKLRQIANEEGILIFQAHPYRPNMSRALPGFLDGVEVFNGNPRHNSQNDLAMQYALQNGLLCSSGSDAHESEDIGRGGIQTEKKIQTIEEMVSLLKNGDYTLIQNG